MDEVERKRFLDTLRRDDDFRATVRRELLTEELLNLPQTVSTLVDVVAQQRQELLNLAQTVTALADVVTQQGQDFTAMATDVRNFMERTITLIGEGFTAMTAELSELRASNRAEASELRADMQAGFTAVDAKFDQVNAELRVIKDQLAS